MSQEAAEHRRLAKITGSRWGVERARAPPKRRRPRSDGSGLRHGLLEVLVDRREEVLRRLVRLVRADQEREVLGHLAALDGLDADALEGLGELRDLGGAVHLAAVREA